MKESWRMVACWEVRHWLDGRRPSNQGTRQSKVWSKQIPNSRMVTKQTHNHHCTFTFHIFYKRLQVIGNSNVKRRVEMMQSTGLNGLNQRLQLRNPKVQYSVSWFTAHEIGLRSNLWLSIFVVHSHFIKVNQRFTRCGICLLWVDLEQHEFDLDNRCLSSGWTMCQSNVCVASILIWETSSCFVPDALGDTGSFKIKRSIIVSHRESYHFINHSVLSKITSQSMITCFTKHLSKLCTVCDCFIRKTISCWN